LKARDRVGVQDFVLLEDYKSENAFVANLQKRYNENLIYTYIGSVLVSVNPYRDLNLYTEYHLKKYQGANFYESPPHVYAISDNVYRSMRNESRDQCILISGESGSGKTEASKHILQHLSVCSAGGDDKKQHIKDQLLKSNPILEAFGNAKTHRNDNSSRFGKYMDIQFDFTGAPVGGHILNYLLEKSRVVHQARGERNFHIFYQLLEGASPELLNKLNLDQGKEAYNYAQQFRSGNLKKEFKEINQALSVLNFSPKTIESLFAIVASVLHIGNINFEENEEGLVCVKDPKPVKCAAKLLKCSAEDLTQSLTHRTIEAGNDKMLSPLTTEQAYYARDAVAKAIYGRLFNWLVQEINHSLSNKDRSRKNVIGLLDIYGFEIFDSNGFEQFCINYCNEKLQQLFIELTLKQEQEEYRSEGITWEPVEYFNNKVICDLIEERHRGIIDILDEECLRPGDATDSTFVEKLEATVGKHKHFMTHALADSKTRKGIGYDEFRLMHYAGDVTYKSKGFLEKNNDLLYRNIKEHLSNSSNEIISTVFTKDELNKLKRPTTVGTQFRTSLNDLMKILMSKEPSYVRCIKPNDNKQSNKFSQSLVRHQIKYLGLMENLRVRRAGFAYRRSHSIFLQRYKSLCTETWPNFRGSDRDGVEALCKSLEYKPDEYRIGKTKVFIRFPRTLFATEDAFQTRKHSLATLIQARYRGWHQKTEYQKMRNAVTVISSHWRKVLAMRLKERRKKAAQQIRKFIIGFMTRYQPRCKENADFIDFVRVSYLKSCVQNLPKSVLDKAWPKSPANLRECAESMQQLNMRNMSLKYVHSCTAQKKAIMQEKLLASSIFKKKKHGYEQSIATPFQNGSHSQHLSPKMLSQLDAGERSLYSCMVTKYDRHGYAPRQRCLVVTNIATYLFENSGKLKQKIPHSNLKGISTSNLGDSVLVLHTAVEQEKEKGDVIIQSPSAFETVTKLAGVTNKSRDVKIVDNRRIMHDMADGKQGCIEYLIGDDISVKKAKNGSLLVVAPSR